MIETMMVLMRTNNSNMKQNRLRKRRDRKSVSKNQFSQRGRHQQRKNVQYQHHKMLPSQLLTDGTQNEDDDDEEEEEEVVPSVLEDTSLKAAAEDSSSRATLQNLQLQDETEEKDPMKPKVRRKEQTKQQRRQQQPSQRALRSKMLVRHHHHHKEVATNINRQTDREVQNVGTDQAAAQPVVPAPQDASSPPVPQASTTHGNLQRTIRKVQKENRPSSNIPVRESCTARRCHFIVSTRSF